MTDLKTIFALSPISWPWGAPFRIEMEFANPANSTDIFSLEWEVLSTPPAKMWLRLLVHNADIHKIICPRFNGFLSRHKTVKDVQNHLNHCIDVINESGMYVIKERAIGEFTQEFANIIHHHFAVLFGSVEKPSEYFSSDAMSQKVRYAILGLNHSIHDLEGIHRAQEVRKQGTDSGAFLTTEWPLPSRTEMPESFYKYFSLDVEFGAMVLHYSQVGKTWWEVYLDRDNKTDNEAIIPLKYVTGEFDAFFVDMKVKETEMNDFHAFLRKRGLDPADPRLGLGFIPVAKFLRPTSLSCRQCVEAIEEHFSLKNIKIFKGKKMLKTVEAKSNSLDLMLPTYT